MVEVFPAILGFFCSMVGLFLKGFMVCAGVIVATWLIEAELEVKVTSLICSSAKVSSNN